jgi:proteasome beta subunit
VTVDGLPGRTDFVELLRARGQDPFAVAGPASSPAGPPVTHATTICAVRYVDGVVMAGDRRATAGNVIAHRSMEKIYPADRHSGVAIAGAAGAAMEMVKLFQLQLEHYEKLEGVALSFEGKANTLAQMVRSNLPAAMQMGMVVVPLFAGYDLRRRKGRIFTYDYTGGRYEEADYQAEGSGGRDARTTIKLGWREGMTRGEVIELAIQGLYEAADEDSATGGPDPIRGIYPLMATITADGFEEVADTDVAERFAALIERKREQAGTAEATAPSTRVTPKKATKS